MILSHLIHLPPLWVQVAVNVVRGEHLRPDAQNGVRVRLSVNQALDDGILGGQVLGLQQVDAHDSLTHGRKCIKSMKDAKVLVNKTHTT